MTIRKKLFFLTIAIFVFPFLAAGSIVIVGDWISGQQLDPDKFIENAADWLYDDFIPAVSAGDPPPLPPEGLRFVFLSADNVVRISTLEAFPEGSRASPEEAAARASVLVAGSSKGLVFTQQIQKDNQTIGFIAVAADVSFSIDSFNLQRRIGTVAFLLAIFLGAAVGGTLVIRNMSRSITALENAAKKIAAGDYDFELVPHGKDEFTSLTNSFETMRAAIKENSAQRARFLMAVSHDLKTPLTSIHGYIEALEDGLAGDEESRKKYLDIIRNKTGMLEDRIFELIDFVRMQTGDWRMTHTTFSLKKFLAEISASFGEDAAIEKKSFTSAINISDAVQVSGDKTLLTRVFENILSNALRYSPANAAIELSAAAGADGSAAYRPPQTEYITITISNSGKAIPAEELELVFEPFYRGTSSRREAGFGLGLSTVRSILDSHGWSIHAEQRSSSAGSESGTSFIIRIPL